jgi:hypothetical protein
MATKRRQYRIRRYVEYLVKSFVWNEETGEWEYETDFDPAPSYREAQAKVKALGRGDTSRMGREDTRLYEELQRHG